MRDSDSTVPIALAGGRNPATEHRAKRIGGAPFVAMSYRRCKAAVAESLENALRQAGVSQRMLARVARVDRRLIDSWLDPEGANGLRLDLALTVALDGGEECRSAVVRLLRDLLVLLGDGPSR